MLASQSGGLGESKGKGGHKGRGLGPVAVAPPNTPRYLAGGIMGLEATCLMLVSEMLSPVEALSLAYSSKAMLDIFASSLAGKAFWKTLLYSLSTDVFGTYSQIPVDQRELVEGYYGCMQIVASISSNKCQHCKKHTSNFNILSGTRSCTACWSCADGGDAGRSSMSPFAICSVSFAQQHHLLTTGMIANGELPVLLVDDPSCAHGLRKDTVTVCLVRDAKVLGEKRWGEGGGEKPVAFRTRNKGQAKSEVKKRAEINVLCRNQRSWYMQAAKEAYGLHRVVGPEELAALPSIFVTHDSSAQVAAKYDHVTPETARIFNNLVEACTEAMKKPGSTMLIDMQIDLEQHFASCDKVKCALAMSNRTNFDVGETIQSDTIHIFEDVKIIGTSRASISSPNAIFWVQDFVRLDVEGPLRLTTNGDAWHWGEGMQQDFSPCIVANGIATFTRCSLESTGAGYVVLAHGQRNMFSDCKLAGSGLGILHLNAPNVSSIVFSGCEISHPANSNFSGWAFCDDQEGPDDWEETFENQAARDNTFLSVGGGGGGGGWGYESE